MRKILFSVILILFTGVVPGQKTVEYLLQAKSFTESGKPDDAIKILSEAIEHTPDSRFFTERAEAYLLKKDYSAAINDFNNANNINPASGEYGLSKIYALKRDVSTALYHLERNLKSRFKKSEKVILLDPAFSIIENTSEWRQFWKKEWYSSYEKGLSEIEYYVSVKNSEEARAVLSDLNRNYPGKGDNIYAGALISVSEANYSGAVGALTGLVTEYPSNEKYLRLLARAQEGARNPSGASVTYSRLLSLGIPDAELLILRAECYRKTGETSKALMDVEKYLEYYPDNKRALSLAGRTESAAGDNLKALEYFSRNLQLHPHDADCYIDRANAYFVSKSWDWAIMDYAMSLDLQPDNPEVWLNKGIALLRSGKTDDACIDFRRALRHGNKKATEYISKYCIK